MNIEELAKMSYRELGDFLDDAITEKLRLVDGNPAVADLYFHIRTYHRITGLMLNMIEAKAGVAKNAVFAIVEVLADEKQKEEISFLIDKATQKHNEEILKEIEEAKG